MLFFTEEDLTSWWDQHEEKYSTSLTEIDADRQTWLESISEDANFMQNNAGYVNILSKYEVARQQAAAENANKDVEVVGDPTVEVMPPNSKRRMMVPGSFSLKAITTSTITTKQDTRATFSMPYWKGCATPSLRFQPPLV